MKRIPITTNIVDLDEYRKKKHAVKQQFKDSLNNEKVMKSYNIQPPTIQEREERIRESVTRINNLLKELEETSK